MTTQKLLHKVHVTMKVSSIAKRPRTNVFSDTGQQAIVHVTSPGRMGSINWELKTKFREGASGIIIMGVRIG